MLDNQIEEYTNQIIQAYPNYSSHRAQIVKLYHDILDKEEYNAFLVKLFKDKFSLEDFEAIINFYQSAVGKKMLTEFPAITQGTIKYSNMKIENNRAKIESFFSNL
jgi:hypothetical protein